MQVTLLYPDREWGREKSYFDKEEICKDLNLHILFRAAACLYDEDGDEGRSMKVAKERDDYISEMVKRVMLVPLATPEEVYYRQQMVKEAVNGYEYMAELYRVAKEAAEDISRFAVAKKKQGYGGSTDQGRKNVADIEYLEHMVHHLNCVEAALQQWKECCITEEMSRFAEHFFEEYSPEYRDCLESVVRDLRSSVTDGILEVTATLGPGLFMSSMALCDIREQKKEKSGFIRNAAGKIGELCKSLFTPEEMTLEGVNQNLLQDIGEIKNAVLGAIMRYFEPFLGEQELFFKQLYAQTSFLMGAANLYRRVRRIGVTLCFPKVTERKDLWFEELVEMSLALTSLRCPVDNALHAENTHLVVITGANQGGKSTYLRSIGIAQVLLQCGMFVPAEQYAGGLYRNIFTHFTRREDSAMNSGRLDEELGRMERIVDNLTEDSVLFLNESFATTTEKEGSLIAEDITRALYDRGVRVMMVTHLMAFAQSCYAKKWEHAAFLSAERTEDGGRTFRMVKKEPELTSYGLDLYDEVLSKKH